MSKKSAKQEKNKGSFTPTMVNKKARFNFHLLDKLEAGITLVGTEVKSVRQANVSLDEAFCRFREGELFLIGCTIAVYEHGNIMNHDPNRPRKLLLHKRELYKLEVQIRQKGLTVVPTRMYFSRGRAKVEIALARGKTHGDKRAKLKDRQIDQDLRRAAARRLR